MTTIEAYSTRPLGIATCKPCDDYSVRVLSFWLHAGYYDEGTEADESRYDSLIADITRKIAEMASLRGPRASVTAARLSKLLERDSDSEEDSDDYTAGS